MVPEDVFELTGAADPRIHPDGRLAAYVAWSTDRESGEYRSAIWLATLDGSEPPRQLTSGEARDAAPRWSPDGSRLAFTSSRGAGEGAKPAQLYVLPLQGGEARRLTDLAEDVTQPAWSPDGERIAFSSRVRDPAYDEEDERKRQPRRFTRLYYKLDNVGWTADRRQHLFVVSADGSGEPQQVTSGEFEHSAPTWSPDGKRLAYVSVRGEDWDLSLATDVFVADADGGGEATRLTASTGGCDLPVWSPDGKEVAFLYTHGTMDWPHHGQVAVVPSDGGEMRLLTKTLDRQCAPYPPVRAPAWQNGRVYFALEDRGNVHVYSVDPGGSAPPAPLVAGERVVTGFDAVGDSVVHTSTVAGATAELHREEKPLTTHGLAFRKARSLSEPERYTAVSEDGTEVDAWIVRPVGFEEGTRYPTLLSVHGGPFAQYGSGFFDEFERRTGSEHRIVGPPQRCAIPPSGHGR